MASSASSDCRGAASTASSCTICRPQGATKEGRTKIQGKEERKIKKEEEEGSEGKRVGGREQGWDRTQGGGDGGTEGSREQWGRELGQGGKQGRAAGQGRAQQQGQWTWLTPHACGPTPAAVGPVAAQQRQRRGQWRQRKPLPPLLPLSPPHAAVPRGRWPAIRPRGAPPLPPPLQHSPARGRMKEEEQQIRSSRQTDLLVVCMAWPPPWPPSSKPPACGMNANHRTPHAHSPHTLPTYRVWNGQCHTDEVQLVLCKTRQGRAGGQGGSPEHSGGIYCERFTAAAAPAPAAPG